MVFFVHEKMELTWEVGEISIVENKIVKFYRILAKL
jgi:hypothetical protein